MSHGWKLYIYYYKRNSYTTIIRNIFLVISMQSLKIISFKRYSIFFLAIYTIYFTGKVPVVYGNCQGCCSSHGGVCCIGGVTKCCDGSSLSSTCRSKGCSVCSSTPLPLTASFSANLINGTAPLSVEFHGSCRYGSLDIAGCEYRWDFGDNLLSSDQNPTHIYDNPGVYSVKLKVNYIGISDTETKIDYINVEKTASFCLCSGDAFNCKDFSTQQEAQACYEQCMQDVSCDVHYLDRNANGIACEILSYGLEDIVDIVIDSSEPVVEVAYEGNKLLYLKVKSVVDERIWILIGLPDMFPDLIFARPSDEYCKDRQVYVSLFKDKEQIVVASDSLFYMDNSTTERIDFGVNNFSGMGTVKITALKGNSSSDLEVIQEIILAPK